MLLVKNVLDQREIVDFPCNNAPYFDRGKGANELAE